MKKILKKIFRSIGYEIKNSSIQYDQNAQLINLLNRRSIESIIDVGANLGQFATELMESGYLGEIISFEPLIEGVEVMKLKRHRYPNWTIHSPVAVGEKVSTISFNVSKNLACSSILAVKSETVLAEPGSVSFEKRLIPMTTLYNLRELYKFRPDRTLLKVDTQGYEENVLKGAATDLSKYNLILLELSLVALYEGQVLWMEIIKYLQPLGFVVWSIHPEFSDPKTGRTLQINVVFVRD